MPPRAITTSLLLGLFLMAQRAVAQQDLGHKVLGAIGLKAGSQIEPGIYVGDRFLYYFSGTLMNRDGHSLPVGLDLDAVSNGFGILGVARLPILATYVSVGFSGPVTHVALNTQQPEASIDRFGLGDLYLGPVRLGWRLPHFDLSVGYGLYIPTGEIEPGGLDGIGRGQFSSDISLGTALYFDRARTLQLSLLTSIELFSHKHSIDITRGSTVQVQGGFSKTLFGFLDVGLVGYGEWQITDDTGSALPPTLQGAREQVFGLGPEVDVLIAPIRTSVMMRYTTDVAAKTRPQGQLLVVGLTVLAWRPHGER